MTPDNPSLFSLPPSQGRTSVYLIRHPAVAVPPGTCYGQSDVALAEPIDMLAATLRAQLPEHFTLLSSPLSRCRLLAEALGTPHLDARLMEIDFGAWELQCFDDIERSLIDAWAADPLNFRAHGGESVAQMAARAVSVLEDMLPEEPHPLVIVGHAGPLRALAGHLQGMPPEAWMQLGFAYGQLQIIHAPR